MSLSTERKVYWEVVGLCLMTFFGRSAGEADTLVRQKQEEWQKAFGKGRWAALPYHEEEVNLAADMAGENLRWTERTRSAYEEILQQAEKTVRARKRATQHRVERAKGHVAASVHG